MRKLITAVKKFTTDDTGATMVEYALMIALVAAVCVVAVTALGSAVSAKFNSVAGSI